MTHPRLCSKTPCGRPAVATLTYVYAESQVVVGALATHAEPHSYDLCADHARRLTAPRGWEVLRLVDDFPDPEPTPDELVAVAAAVRTPRPSGPPAAQREQQPRDDHAPRRRTLVASTDPARAPQGSLPGGRPAGGRGPERPAIEVSAVEVGRRGHLRVLREEAVEPQDPAAR